MTKYLRGRRFQPAAFTLMCVAFLEAVTLLPIGPWHETYHTSPGWLSAIVVHGAGTLGLLAGVAFLVGWFRNDARIMDKAFMASGILWLWAAFAGILQGAAFGRIVFAFMWAVLAIGSAWLEEASND